MFIRKPNRLKDKTQYSENNWHFITLVESERKPIFSTIPHELSIMPSSGVVHNPLIDYDKTLIRLSRKQF